MTNLIETNRTNKPVFEHQGSVGSLLPLGQVSDYVIERLPILLLGLRTNLVDPAQVEKELETLCGKNFEGRLAEVAHRQNYDEIRVALLDLTMIRAAAGKHLLKVPDSVSEGITRLAEVVEAPPTLTYELIVQQNPIEVTRVFSVGTTADAERAFYRGHAKMDRKLEPGVEKMLEAIVLLKDGRRPDIVRNLLEEAIPIMADIVSDMAKFAEFDESAFDEFRPYLMGEPGPSGAFSAQLCSTLLLIFGENPPERTATIRRQIAYYPKPAVSTLKEVLDLTQQGYCFTHFGRTESPVDAETKAKIASLAELGLKFLQIHILATARILPELFSKDGALGTAGLPAAKFLRNGVRAAIEEVKRLRRAKGEGDVE